MPRVYPQLSIPVAVLLCSYSIAQETTVVSAAIPTVIRGFGGLSDLSWVFSSYLVAQAVSMPLFGSASDRLGRKRCYNFAAAIFCIGTLACGLCWDMLSLIAFRVLQGIGGGGLITVGTAALHDVIPQTSRGKYQALGSAVWGIAAISGPIVGSMIMELLDWRYIFWVNLPIVLLSAVLLSLSYRERTTAAASGELAVLPSVYLCVSLLAVMALLVHGSELSLLSFVVCAAAGGLAAVLLVMAQRHSADPLIPRGLLRIKVVALAVLSAFICGAISMGLTVYMPSFAAVVLAADYFAISATVGVMTLTWTFSGIVVGVFIRSGLYRPSAILAGWVVLAGALVLCFVAKASHGMSLLMFASAVLGIGLGGCSVVFSVAVQSTVSDADRGSATALFYLSRMFGQSIGVALCGGVLASSDSLVHEMMQQPPAADSTLVPQAVAAHAALTGSVSSEFGVVFAVIAALALVQLAISVYTPSEV